MKKVVLFFAFCFFLAISGINANDSNHNADYQVIVTDCGSSHWVPADVSVDNAVDLIDTFTKIFCVFD